MEDSLALDVVQQINVKRVELDVLKLLAYPLPKDSF